VVHATNGWIPHLLPGFRTKIAPFRGQMSAQRPGQSLHASTLHGSRAFVFHVGELGYDYLTQLPEGEHELMFGGGFALGGKLSTTEIGEADDGGYNITVASHIAGSLPLYFGLDNWGAEAEKAKESQWEKGRLKALWTGVIAFSTDGRPWVGRVPAKASGRTPPALTATPKRTKAGGSEHAGAELLTDGPGEWMAAGYSGEGMTNAWQSGRALAYMLLGVEQETRMDEWFPEIMRTGEKRLKQASIGKMLDRFLA